MKIILLITVLVLLSCDDALANDLTMNCSRTGSDRGVNFGRCENEEIICYYRRGTYRRGMGDVSCKWK